MQKSYYRLNNRIYSIYNSAKPHKKNVPKPMRTFYASSC